MIYGLIIFFQLLALAFFVPGFFYWKGRHSDAIEMWTKEREAKNKMLVELDDKVKELEGRDKIIKIESIVSQPKTLSCKFTVHNQFIADSKLFKNIVIREVAREIAEELTLNPYSYQLFFTESYVENSEKVEVRIRILPYIEAAVWEEEKK